jgi:hypothetical protein
MRSTAASEALAQLGQCAITGLQKGFPEVIALNFIPAIKQIHSVCLANQAGSPYNRHLASDSIRQVLQVWWTASETRRALGGRSAPHQQFIEFLREVAPLNFVCFKHPDVGGSDFISELSIKDARDKATLQDIALLILWRTNKDSWELSSSVEDLVKMVELLGQLIIAATKGGVWNAGYLCAALYEIGYVCLHKLPADYRGEELGTKEVNPLRGRSGKLPERTLTEALYSVWTNVVKLSEFSARQDEEWHQSLIGLLGVGLLKYQDQPTLWLKAYLEKGIITYKEAVKAMTEDPHSVEDPWAYLQLMGAWCGHFLANDVLESEILQLVAERRGLRRGHDFGGGRSRYVWFGYPAGELGGDFFLPLLRNLRPPGYLSHEDWGKFQSMQGRLMNDSVLMPFYHRLRSALGADDQTGP